MYLSITFNKYIQCLAVKTKLMMQYIYFLIFTEIYNLLGHEIQLLLKSEH